MGDRMKGRTPQINQMWSVFSVMGAVCVLFMTPPGLISAALARIRCPKKIILDRKVLSDMAITDPDAFAQLVEVAKKAL